MLLSGIRWGGCCGLYSAHTKGLEVRCSEQRVKIRNQQKQDLSWHLSFIHPVVLRQGHSLSQSYISVRIKWPGWTLNFSIDYDAFRTTKTAFFTVISTEPPISHFGHSRYDIKGILTDLSQFQDTRRLPRSCWKCKDIVRFLEFRVASLMSVWYAVGQFALPCWAVRQ
jgi:hypothetical protein